MPCLLALLALEHLALDPAGNFVEMLMTTAISKEAIAQSERANGGFRVIARWVQGQCRDGSCWPTVSPLPSSSPSPTSSLRDIRSVFINIAPRRLMLTNGVVAAAIITVTDLSSQVM
uniref:Uncharacterized protein n=1 Tax=Oryza meridionalis TaxID=40149 RepID=A0A0E0DJN8_9ORYZ